MKLVITALALIAFSGCATYVARDGSYSLANEIEQRDCRQVALNDKTAPSLADFHRSDGMGAFNRAAAERLETLIHQCMARKGLRPA